MTKDRSVVIHDLQSRELSGERIVVITARGYTFDQTGEGPVTVLLKIRAGCSALQHRGGAFSATRRARSRARKSHFQRATLTSDTPGRNEAELLHLRIERSPPNPERSRCCRTVAARLAKRLGDSPRLGQCDPITQRQCRASIGATGSVFEIFETQLGDPAVRFEFRFAVTSHGTRSFCKRCSQSARGVPNRRTCRKAHSAQFGAPLGLPQRLRSALGAAAGVGLLTK